MKHSAASSSIPARFAAAARTYDLESAVQKAVAQKLATLLPPSESIDTILEIGCGAGAFTELLAGRFPSASIDAVDISAPMIDAARKRLGQSPRLRWHTADAGRFYPAATFSLIASSSALHWITPASAIMKRIAALLAPGASLVAALMVEGTLGELHDARARLFPHKAPPVRLPPVAEILQAIAAAGLGLGVHRCETRSQTCGSARQLLRSLNRQGVTGRQAGDRPLLNRTELLELSQYYDRQFRAPEGGVIATWNILYVTARKEA